MKKKGFAEITVDVYSTIIIILLIIVFFAMFNAYGKNMRLGMDTKIAAADSNILLSNYLRYDIEYEGKKMSMADFFDRADLRVEKGSFEQNTYDYFTKFHKLSGCRIMVTITVDGDDFLWETPDTDDGICAKYQTSYLAEQIVPSMDGKSLTARIEGGVK